MVSWACPVAQLLTEELTDLRNLFASRELTDLSLTPETKLTTEKKSTPHFYCNMDILYYEVKCVATLE